LRRDLRISHGNGISERGQEVPDGIRNVSTGCRGIPKISSAGWQEDFSDKDFEIFVEGSAGL
jgi:hypothetical protein